MRNGLGRRGASVQDQPLLPWAESSLLALPPKPFDASVRKHIQAQAEALPKGVETLSQVLAFHGISGDVINLAAYQEQEKLRTYQVAPVHLLIEAFKKGKSVLLCGPTGSGKTTMTIPMLALVAQEHLRALVLTPQGHLVQQWIERIGQFLKLPSGQIANVSGDGLERHLRHKALRQDDLAVCVGSPQAAANDLAALALNPSAFKVILADEIHEARKRHLYVDVINAARTSSALIVAMSATPGKSVEEIEERMRLLGAETYVPVFPPSTRIEPLKVIVSQLPEVEAVAKTLKEVYRERLGELKAALSIWRSGESLAKQLVQLHTPDESMWQEIKRRIQAAGREPTPEDRFCFPGIKALQDFGDKINGLAAVMRQRAQERGDKKLKDTGRAIPRLKGEIIERLAMLDTLRHRGKYAFLEYCFRHRAAALFPLQKHKISMVRRAYRSCLRELKQAVRDGGEVTKPLRTQLKKLGAVIDGEFRLPVAGTTAHFYSASRDTERRSPKKYEKHFREIGGLVTELGRWQMCYEDLGTTAVRSLNGLMARFRDDYRFNRRLRLLALERPLQSFKLAYLDCHNELRGRIDALQDQGESVSLRQDELLKRRGRNLLPADKSAVAEYANDLQEKLERAVWEGRDYSALEDALGTTAELYGWASIFEKISKGDAAAASEKQLDLELGQVSWRERALKLQMQGSKFDWRPSRIQTTDINPWRFDGGVYSEPRTRKAIMYLANGCPREDDAGRTWREYNTTFFAELLQSHSWSGLREKYCSTTDFYPDYRTVRKALMQRAREDLASRKVSPDPKILGFYIDSRGEEVLFQRLKAYMHTDSPTKIIAYADTPGNCRYLAQRIREQFGEKWEPSVLLGLGEGYTSKVREAELERFRSGVDGKSGVLLMTSAGVLGTDIPKVKEVVAVTRISDPILAIQLMGRIRGDPARMTRGEVAGTFVTPVYDDPEALRAQMILRNRVKAVIRGNEAFVDYIKSVRLFGKDEDLRRYVQDKFKYSDSELDQD